jgi:hypothetical protein
MVEYLSRAFALEDIRGVKKRIHFHFTLCSDELRGTTPQFEPGPDFYRGSPLECLAP